MALRDEIIKAIEEAGFNEYKDIQADELIFDPLVFDACAENKCGNYGKNHSCPPLSGNLEENKARFLSFGHWIIINKIVDLGEFYENYQSSLKEVSEAFAKLDKLLEDKPVQLAGAGGCKKCKECAARTGEPCRFPDKRNYSMEGSGLDIMNMSRNLGLTYNAGDNKIGYFFMVMY